MFVRHPFVNTVFIEFELYLFEKLFNGRLFLVELHDMAILECDLIH